MPPALSAAAVANTNGTSGTTLAVTLNGVAAGDLIVVACDWWASDSSDITCGVSDGNAYTSTSAALILWSASSFGRYQLFYYPNASAGNKTITMTTSGNTAWRQIQAMSFSGVATTSPQDASAQVSAIGNSANASSGNWTNTTADCLVIGSVCCDAASITSPSSPWVEGINDSSMVTAYQVVSTSAARAMTATLTSNTWVAAICGFKAASGGGGSASLTPPVGAVALAGGAPRLDFGLIPPTMIREG